MAFGNGGRRFGRGGGTRLGFGGYLPRQPGILAAADANEPGPRTHVEPPTRNGDRTFDRTDRAEERGYQDELEQRFPVRRG